MAKKYTVIDTHNHYMPASTASKNTVADGMDYAASFKGGRSFGWQRALDLEKRVKFMDDAGVDIAVLEQSASSPQGLDYCKDMNAGYCKGTKEFPNRFLPCVHVPLEANPQVYDEIDRAVKEYGFRGMSLVSSTSKYTLDSEELFPLYEKVSKMDLPILVHPSIRRPIWGGVKYSMSQHVSREYDVCKASVEVLYGVLPRFPDLKFVMPHHGGGMPSVMGRILQWFEPEGWKIPAEIKGMPKTPREMKELGLDKEFARMFEKLYFDLAGFSGWMPITEAAVKVIRPDRLCFGTDFPFEIHEPQDVKTFIDGIMKLNVSEKDKENMLGGNIKRLFKI
jgi:predicted TIM-barrel fold metal-dependent hydrolase